MENTIQKTTNYEMFKTIKGNRKVTSGHVDKLVKAIEKNNLLSLIPVVVNSKYEVVDGQHRLEAAKKLKLPIYYIVMENGGLSDIQMLNSTTKVWNAHDYLHSYTSQGLPDYLKLKEYVDYGVTVANAILILSSKSYRSWGNFKEGKFTVKDEKEAQKILDAYMGIKKYTVLRVWNDREFLRTLMKTLEKVSTEQLLRSVNEYGEFLEHKDTAKEYLRQFEEVLNYRQRINIVRLF